MRVLSLFGRPEFLAKFHTIAGWLWFIFGLVGVAEFLLFGTDAILANSIPVLFFISVYANTVGHWSSQQAAKVEVKQDQEIDKKD